VTPNWSAAAYERRAARRRGLARDCDSAEAQPQAVFLEALSRLVGRIVRSDAPGMDAVTVLCKARGYIARQEEREWRS
jgi:hypothetical protein